MDVETNTTHVVVVDRYFDAAYAALLKAHFPELAVTCGTSFAEVRPALGDAHVLFALGHLFTQEIVDAAPRLRWVQALTTGTDAIERIQSLPSHVLVTSARGIHAPQMSEMAFCHMLSLTHRLSAMWDNQTRGAWVRWPQALLYRKTVAILGTGVIAQGLARRCKAFEMHVVGVTATPRPIECFDRVVSREKLFPTLGEADYVVCLLPSNAANDGLVDARFLATMRRSAFFINMSRGSLVDEDALVQALQAERIAGAGLDAFRHEPLPPDSALWHTPRLLISPKHGGTTEIYVDQIRPILLHNMAAFLEGRPDDMQNRVR